MLSGNLSNGFRPSSVYRCRGRVPVAGALALGSLLLCLATPAFSQLDRGTILGTVVDPSGAVIPDATIKVINQGTTQTLTLTTGPAGAFIAPQLLVGTYRVSATASGFAEYVIENISLHASDRINLELKLRPATTREVVTVTSLGAVVEAASTTYGGKILAPEINNLPINGRDPMQLLQLIPGVSMQGGFNQQSVNGQNYTNLAGDTSTFLLDGGDSGRVDYQLPDNTYGRSQNRITHAGADTIQEFSISNNSFSAEYGGSAGSVVNIITKSGTNEFHGDAYEYFRNDVLDARNYFNPEPGFKPPFRLNQFGGSLGGPIVKDRAWFFGNYEGIRQRTGITQSTFVPTAAFRQALPDVLQPVVAMLPLPNGPVSTLDPRLGAYNVSNSNLLNEDTAFGKVDFEITPRDRLWVRYNMEKSLTQSYFGVAEGQVTPTPGFLQNAQISYTRNISDSMVNVASFTFNRMRIDPLSSNVASVRDFPIVGIGGSAGVGPALFDLLVANNSFSWRDTLSYVRGRNQLETGLQIVRNQDNKQLTFQRSVTYLTLTDFANNAAFAVGTLGQPRAGLRNTYWAFFAQDNFQATPKLSLNGGLRYQYDTAPSESHGRIDNFNPQTGSLTPVGDPYLNMPKLNFAPRVGIAYKPFTDYDTVVRASFGLFFTVFNASYMQNSPNNIFQQNFSLNVFQDPTLQGFPFPPITEFAEVTSYTAVQHNWGDPYVEAWNFDIQQGIGHDARLDVAYVGNRTVHALNSMDLNRQFPGTGVRPYTGLGTISYLWNGAFGNYNALQVNFTKRLSQGLMVHANYTYGHALTDAFPLFTSAQDDHNPRMDYGNDSADVTHVLEFDYVYQLPSVPSVPKVLGGGWQLNGITTMRSGLPYSVVCGCDPMQVGQANGLANRVSGVPIRPANFNIPANQINLAAFATPPTGTWGTAGNNAFRGPAAFNWDFSLFKDFRIRERQTLQFRAEVFNIFNTPQFTNPSASLTAPSFFGGSFGTLSNLAGFPTQRQIQFALRYSF